MKMDISFRNCEMINGAGYEKLLNEEYLCGWSELLIFLYLSFLFYVWPIFSGLNLGWTGMQTRTFDTDWSRFLSFFQAELFFCHPDNSVKARHTHNHLTSLYPGLSGWASTRRTITHSRQWGRRRICTDSKVCFKPVRVLDTTELAYKQSAGWPAHINSRASNRLWISMMAVLVEVPVVLQNLLHPLSTSSITAHHLLDSVVQGKHCRELKTLLPLRENAHWMLCFLNTPSDLRGKEHIN